MNSANDGHFDPRQQLRTLSEDQLLDYVASFVDQNCAELDAAYLKEVIQAGPASLEVTHLHAVRGSPVAQLAKGMALISGEHVDRNIAEGLFWLLRASNNGNPQAAVILADTYAQGRHVPRSMGKALHFASLAAERELPAGQFYLANLLVGGDGIPEDQPRAIALLRAAAAKGLPAALRMLDDNGIPFTPA